MSEIIVIGGGAAGMMAAIGAARAGARVTLLERNEKLGKKIYITGKGRCNVTNAADEDSFMRAIVRNPRFCYAALSCLNNAGIMAFFEERGVPLKVERGERVFPVSDHASDITRALEREMARLGAAVALNTRAQALMLDERGAAAGVVTERGRMLCADAVIVATGGQSYPSTGSTGDGWAMAEATGHRTKPALPALTSIETVESWPFALSGLSLKNVALSAFNAKNKRFYHEQGELLMTHFGISGPLALTLSSLLPEDPAGTRLELNLKPALDEATLDRRLVRDLTEQSRRQLITVGINSIAGLLIFTLLWGLQGGISVQSFYALWASELFPARYRAAAQVKLAVTGLRLHLWRAGRGILRCRLRDACPAAHLAHHRHRGSPQHPRQVA